MTRTAGLGADIAETPNYLDSFYIDRGGSNLRRLCYIFIRAQNPRFRRLNRLVFPGLAYVATVIMGNAGERRIDVTGVILYAYGIGPELKASPSGRSWHDAAAHYVGGPRKPQSATIASQVCGRKTGLPFALSSRRAPYSPEPCFAGPRLPPREPEAPA